MYHGLSIKQYTTAYKLQANVINKFYIFICNISRQNPDIPVYHTQRYISGVNIFNINTRYVFHYVFIACKDASNDGLEKGGEFREVLLN